MRSINRLGASSLWEIYRPQMELYVTGALDPDRIPYPEI